MTALAVVSSAGFDYNALDEAVASDALDAARKIKVVGRQHVIEIGRILLDMKPKLDRENFLPWCMAEFGMTERTADQFMHAATVFADKAEAVSRLAPRTVHRLAAAPEAVRAGVLTRIEGGEEVSGRQVDLAIARNTTPLAVIGKGHKALALSRSNKLPAFATIKPTHEPRFTKALVQMRSGALRGLARRIKEAADMALAADRATMTHARADVRNDVDEFRHLDMNIELANAATRLALEAINDFVGCLHADFGGKL